MLITALWRQSIRSHEAYTTSFFGTESNRGTDIATAY